MSTNSLIGRALPNGKIEYIYCHSDGYPSWVGRHLLNHYTDAAKVDALLALGSLSCLSEEIGEKHDFRAQCDPPFNKMCTAYGRDRGEENTQAQICDGNFYFLGRARNCGAEWVYLFNDGKWTFTKVNERKGFPQELFPLTTEDVTKD